ncbi:hypothetical protein Ancab_030148 [Ancistrocladus abbreviatus]
MDSSLWYVLSFNGSLLVNAMLSVFLFYLPIGQTAADDGVKLWDLRKLRNFWSFSPFNSNTATNSVYYDHRGSYLALAGSNMRIYQVASVKLERNCIKILPHLSGTVSSPVPFFHSTGPLLPLSSH